MTLKKQVNLFEIKELRGANVSVEPFLKAFDKCLINLQLEYNNFIDYSVKATIQVFLMQVFLVVLKLKLKFFWITLPSMRREEEN